MECHSCRTCMYKREPQELTNIFSTFCGGRIISDVLKQIAPVEIAKDDALPKMICSACLQRLKSFCEFRMVVVNSDEKLREKIECQSVVSSLKQKLNLKLQNGHNQERDCAAKGADGFFVEYCLESAQSQREECDSDEIEQKCTEFEVVDNSLEEYPLGVLTNKDDFSGKDDIDRKYTKVEIVDNPLQDFNEIEKYEHKVLLPQIKPSAEGSPTGTNLQQEAKPKVCAICNKTFKTSRSLKMHTLRHSSMPMPHSCDICGKGFPMKYMINSHRIIHFDERKYKCPVEECGKKFRYKCGLLSHRKVHLGVKPHVCDICGKALSSPNSLQNHLLIHKGEIPFMCEYCSRAFRNKGELCKHLKTHKGPKPTENCSICGRSYPKVYLKRHMAIHIDKEEKGIECEVCKKKFSDKSIINDHMNIHLDVKPYTCKLCNKSFRTSGVLWKHRRVHTGETPFHCAHCPKQFGYKHHLITHIQKNHPIRPE